MINETVIFNLLPTIKRTAAKLCRGSEDHYLDLIQEGLLALITDGPKYFKNDHATFDTFIYHRIKGAMIDYLRKYGRYQYTRRGGKELREHLTLFDPAITNHLTTDDFLSNLIEEINFNSVKLKCTNLKQLDVLVALNAGYSKAEIRKNLNATTIYNQIKFLRKQYLAQTKPLSK